VWIRATAKPSGNDAGSKTHVLEMGLTKRGVEDIGDVSSILLERDPEESLSEGEDLLRINWDCHSITAADELYHTVWETVDGVTKLKSPVAGTIRATDIGNPWVDADDSLLSIAASEKSIANAFPNLMDEDAYNKFVEKIAPGRFSESDRQTAFA
jgi:hypothetical protein